MPSIRLTISDDNYLRDRGNTYSSSTPSSFSTSSSGLIDDNFCYGISAAEGQVRHTLDSLWLMRGEVLIIAQDPREILTRNKIVIHRKPLVNLSLVKYVVVSN